MQPDEAAHHGKAKACAFVTAAMGGFCLKKRIAEPRQIARGDPDPGVVHGKLDFFRVQYGTRITAGVSGTAFSVDATRNAVTIVCTRDEVSVAKTGDLLIGTKRKRVTLFDTIGAGNRSVTYHPSSTWTLGAFATYAAAQTVYSDRLAASKKSGDRTGWANALKNIGNVTESQGQYAAALAA